MKLLAIIVCLLMTNTAHAYTYNSDNYEGTQELLEEWYAEVCPYGDAVITYKDANNTEAGKVDCVVYDKRLKMWSTWKGDINDTITRGGIDIHTFNTWDPKKYRVWTMDGELVIDKNSHVIVRKTYTDR